MKCGKTVLVIPLLAMLCAGCANPFTPRLYTARFADVTAGNYFVPTHQFGAGQSPALVVSGLGGQTVTIRILDLAAGWVVAEKTEHISYGHLHRWWSTDLPNGSYLAVLLVGNNIQGTTDFAIHH